jgi:proline dehydrogenase
MGKKKTYLLGMIWALSNFIAKRAAQAYIVGPELNDAMGVCDRLSKNGFSSTIGFWSAEEESARKVADAYVAGLMALKEKNTDCYLSIKLPAIGFSSQLLAEVLQKGKQNSVRIHFDSHGPETVDPTWSKITEALPVYRNLGCVLPGRWHRSPEDAEWAIENNLKVRVVKGQWVDPEATDIELCTGFLRVIDRLAGRACQVGVATHDIPLAEEAIKRLKAADTPCEMELLYGLPARGSVRLAQRLGVGVRFYVPYGYGWLPYSLSWASRNPRVFWWMVKDFVMSGSSRNMWQKKNNGDHLFG